MTRALLWTLAAVLIAAPGGAQWITGSGNPEGGAVGGSGTAGKLAKFTAAQTLGDSILTESGTVVTVAGTLNATNFNGIIGATTPAAGAFTTVVGSTSVSSPTLISTAAMTIVPNAGASTLAITSSKLILDTNGNLALGGASVTFGSGGVTVGASGAAIGLSSGGQITFGSVVNGGTTLTFTGNANFSFTSGTAVGVSGAFTFNPTSTSTQVGIAHKIAPTINYSAGTPGAGHYEALQIAPNETALPTGTNYLLRMFAGATGTTERWAFLNTGAAFAFNLTAASGTPNSICQDNATKELTVNAALTCTVSSRRFKNSIRDQGDALPIIAALHPRSFRMNDSPAWRVGFIAEEVETVDPRLVSYDVWNRPHSVRYEDIVSVLTKALQELRIEVDALKRSIADGRV